MPRPSASDPSPRRFAFRAIALAAPAIAAAILLPRLTGRAGTVAPLQEASAAARAVAARQAAESAAMGTGLPGEKAGEERRPRVAEAPTPDQIEAAREARVALGKAERGWEKVTVIAPREPSPAADGTTTVPFDGFAVSVESEPAGARVTLDGRPLGETPVMASVKCAPGASLDVVVEKGPLPPRRVPVRCQADTLVRLSLRLTK
jgi:type II secretory pathway pseudopilin PulG